MKSTSTATTKVVEFKGGDEPAVSTADSGAATSKVTTAVVSRSHKRNAWVVTWLLFGFMLINFGDKAVLGLAAAPIKADLGISDSMYGTLSSSFYFLFSIAAIGAGALSTRLSNRWLLLIMGITWAVFQLPILIPSAGIAVLFVSRIALGAGEGPAWPTAQNTVYTWFKDEDRGLPAGLLGIGVTVGVIVAAPSLTWVIGQFGWRWAFGTMAIVGLVWCGVWAAFGKEGPYAVVGKQPDEADIEDNIVGSEHVSTLRLFFSRTWLGCALGYGCYYWAMVILSAWVPLYLHEVQGFSTGRAGVLIMIPWAFFGLTMVVNGLVSKPLMRRGVSTSMVRGVFSGIALAVSAVAMFAVTRVEIGGITAIVLLTIAFGAYGPMATNATIAVGEIAPVRRRGLLLGVFSGVTAIGAVVAPMVLGFLIDAGSTTALGYQHGFDLTAVLLVIGALAGIFLIRPTGQIAKWKAENVARGRVAAID